MPKVRTYVGEMLYNGELVAKIGKVKNTTADTRLKRYAIALRNSYTRSGLIKQIQARGIVWEWEGDLERKLHQLNASNRIAGTELFKFPLKLMVV